MAVTFIGTSGGPGHTASDNTTASITPTRNASTASGDRVYVLQSHDCVAGSATPASWTALYKDVAVGTGTPAAGTGARYISCYYRDYDGVWSMPAFDLVSATNNTQGMSSFTIRKGSTETWDTPTYSNVADNYGTPTTAFSVTTAAFATIAGALLITQVTVNDPETSTAQAISGTNGFVKTGLFDEWVDNATAGTIREGFKLWITFVGTAASPAGTLTISSTMTGATEGGVCVIQQTATTPPSPSGGSFLGFF